MMRFRSLLLGSVVLLTACGGGGASSSASGTPQLGSSAAPASVPVTIRIDDPAASAQAAKRRPAYLSPATQSITISVNGGAPVAQNLTPAGGNCSTPSFGATPVCTLVANAPVGNDTFTFVTYDQANGAGNALSQNTVAQKIVSGQGNTVAVTLDGVPTGVLGSPYPGQANVVPSASGYTLMGTTAATFLIVATDADGNVIVGPGAPTLTVKSGSANLTVTAVANNPNKYILTPVTSGVAVTVSLSAAGGNGGTAGGAVALALKALPPTSLPQTLYSYVTGSNEIDAFAVGSINASAPAYKLTSPLLTAIQDGLAWAPGGALDAAGDTDTGDLIVQYSAAQLAAGSGTPTVILQSYLSNPIQPNLLTELGGFAIDSKGDIFIIGEKFSNPPPTSTSIFEYKPPFTPTTVPTLLNLTGITSPSYIYVDGSDNLYVANAPPNTPTTIMVWAASSPSGAAVRTIGGPNSNGGFSSVGGMAAGADGTLTVVDGTSYVIYGFAPNPPNNPSPEYVFQSPSNLFSSPITVDANDNVYGLQFLAPGNQLDVYPAGSSGVPTALFTLQLTAPNPLLTPVSLLFAP